MRTKDFLAGLSVLAIGSAVCKVLYDKIRVDKLDLEVDLCEEELKYAEFEVEDEMLNDLALCSLRYLTGASRGQMDIDEYKENLEYARRLKALVEEYRENLNERCIAETGKPLKGLS